MRAIWANQLFAKILLELWTKGLEISLISFWHHLEFPLNLRILILVNSAIISFTFGHTLNRSPLARLLKSPYTHSHCFALLSQSPFLPTLLHPTVFFGNLWPTCLPFPRKFLLPNSNGYLTILTLCIIYNHLPGIVLILAWSVPVLKKFSLVLKTSRWKNNYSFTIRKLIAEKREFCLYSFLAQPRSSTWEK